MPWITTQDLIDMGYDLEKSPPEYWYPPAFDVPGGGACVKGLRYNDWDCQWVYETPKGSRKQRRAAKASGNSA
jgi:hypothetical protein